MSIKFYILFVASILMGIMFMVAGFYFLSPKFINKLNEAAPEKSEEIFKKNRFKAKGSAYVALSIGAITLVWAALMFLMPQALNIFVLVYMVLLMIAACVLVFAFR